MIGLLSLVVFACCDISLYHITAQQIVNQRKQEDSLQNVKQLTFPSMGFEKAGEAYFSPDGQTIIFQAVPKGKEQYQIFVMNITEGIPRMVSTGLGACTCAYFRPDGKKIIFASSHSDPMLNNPDFDQAAPGYKREGGNYGWEFTPYMNIYEANPDGSNLTPLTSGAAYTAECAYCSDGSRIVFASNRSGSMNIYTMSSDGTDIQQVTNTDSSYNGGPFLSPDNKRIVFRSDREKADYLQIYVVDVDGTNEQQVTFNDAVNWAPYWYPNGEVIAYTTSLHGHWQYEIYLMNILTEVQYRLTYNPTFDGLPVFSNDGKHILWTSKRGPDNTCQIFIANFVMPECLN